MLHIQYIYIYIYIYITYLYWVLDYEIMYFRNFENLVSEIIEENKKDLSSNR